MWRMEWIGVEDDEVREFAEGWVAGSGVFMGEVDDERFWTGVDG